MIAMYGNMLLYVGESIYVIYCEHTQYNGNFG